MRIEVLGGCPSGFDNIGPIGLRIRTDSGVVLVADYGLGYGREGNKALSPLSLTDSEVDYFVLTHIHTDHAGLIPWAMKRFPKAELVTTVPTFALGNPVWSDTGRIAARNRYPGLAPFDPQLYENMRRRSILLAQPGWLHLKKDVRIYLGSNGHTRGSAYIVIEADGKRLAISGDLGLSDTPTILGMRAGNVPADVPPVDCLFLESTHGDKSLESRAAVVARMNQAVIKTLRTGGQSLATALGVERSQDIALDQVLGGVVDLTKPDSKVYLDGLLAGLVWDIYQRDEGYWSENDVPIAPEMAERIVCLEEHGHDFRERMVRRGYPYSIISSSGSLKGGPSVFWAKAILQNPRSLILQCNYQFEGTPGAELQRLGRGFKLDLDGEKICVWAAVMRVDASAHAGAPELVEAARWFGPGRIALYHGAWSARRALQRRLRREGFHGPLVSPLNGDVIEI